MENDRLRKENLALQILADKGNHNSYQKYVNEFKENSYNFTTVDEFKEALEILENRVFKLYDYQHDMHNDEDLAHYILIMDLKDTFDRIIKFL